MKTGRFFFHDVCHGRAWNGGKVLFDRSDYEGRTWLTLRLKTGRVFLFFFCSLHKVSSKSDGQFNRNRCCCVLAPLFPARPFRTSPSRPFWITTTTGDIFYEQYTSPRLYPFRSFVIPLISLPFVCILRAGFSEMYFVRQLERSRKRIHQCFEILTEFTLIR